MYSAHTHRVDHTLAWLQVWKVLEDPGQEGTGPEQALWFLILLNRKAKHSNISKVQFVLMGRPG